MIASVEARELEDDIARVEASVGDLIGAEETETMAKKTWDFGLYLMTKKMLADLEKEVSPQARQSFRRARQSLKPVEITLSFSRTFLLAAFASLLLSSFIRFSRNLISRFTTLLQTDFLL
jgi:hypothetical protein